MIPRRTSGSSAAPRLGEINDVGEEDGDGLAPLHGRDIGVRRPLRQLELWIAGAGSTARTRWSSGEGSIPSSSTSVSRALLEGLEGFSLPSRAVERQHQLSEEPFAQRVFGDQRLQLADHR